MSSALPNQSRSVMETLAELFNNEQLIPVIGAGFSQNVLENPKPVNWQQLATTALQTAAACSNDVEFLVNKCEDYLTAISTVAIANRNLRSTLLNRIADDTKHLAQRHLPVHMAFWSTPWRVVVTTNFDRLLHVTYPPIKYGYSQQLPHEFKREAATQDVAAVFYLHGCLDCGTQTAAFPPLLTWEDYIFAYKWTSCKQQRELIDLMAKWKSHLCPADGNRYRDILEKTICHSNAAATARTGVSHQGIPDLIRALLSEKSCLFLGFSISDPLWRFILHSLPACRGKSPRHFMVGHNDKQPHLPDFVQHIEIGCWENFKPWLAELSRKLTLREELQPEKTQRQSAYEDIVATYKECELHWLSKGTNGGNFPLVPFREIWCNSKTLEVDQAVQATVLSPQSFTLSSDLSQAEQALWHYREEQQQKSRTGIDLIDEKKIRVAEYSRMENGGLAIKVQVASYKQFLVTNHLVANGDSAFLGALRGKGSADLADLLSSAFDVDGVFSPRRKLCGDESKLEISQSAACSNHLGGSLMLIVDLEVPGNPLQPVFLCPPSRGQISSPNDLIPTASGSFDWPLKPDACSRDDIVDYSGASNKELNLCHQIWREFGEECVSGIKLEQQVTELEAGKRFGEIAKVCTEWGQYQRKRLIKRAELLNLCQNVERGGKPELFYLASAYLGGKEFIEEEMRFNWELLQVWSLDAVYSPQADRERRTMLLMPSPLDSDLKLHGKTREALKCLVDVISDNHFNSVLRAHLASILLYLDRKFPKELRQAICEIGFKGSLTVRGCEQVITIGGE